MLRGLLSVMYDNSEKGGPGVAARRRGHKILRRQGERDLIDL